MTLKEQFEKETGWKLIGPKFDEEILAYYKAYSTWLETKHKQDIAEKDEEYRIIYQNFLDSEDTIYKLKKEIAEIKGVIEKLIDDHAGLFITHPIFGKVWEDILLLHDKINKLEEKA